MARTSREKQNEYNRAWYRRNRKRVVGKTSARRRLICLWLREYKSLKPCVDCGAVYPHYVMDLDHRDPETKVDHLSNMVRRKGLGAVKAEVEKCDLVCANCHRIRTFERLSRSRQDLNLQPLASEANALSS